MCICDCIIRCLPSSASIAGPVVEGNSRVFLVNVNFSSKCGVYTSVFINV